MLEQVKAQFMNLYVTCELTHAQILLPTPGPEEYFAEGCDDQLCKYHAVIIYYTVHVYKRNYDCSIYVYITICLLNV